MTIIQNISLRQGHRDIIYGTGDWAPWELKDVPDDIGKKMIEHVDVYVEIDGSAIPPGSVPKITPPTPFQEDELQEFYDKLILMSKEQMASFIETRFNIRVDVNNFASDDALRAHTRMLVDQYGAL